MPMDREHLMTLSTDELVRLALEENDGETRWDYVVVLHKRSTQEVFDAAAQLSRSPVAKERCLGTDILGQATISEKTFAEEALEILFRMTVEELDPDALSSALVAIGHAQDIEDMRNLDQVIAHCNNPDADVRFGVVSALTGREDSKSVAAMLGLMRDENTDVRDYATFGIGELTNVDTPEIREALFERLNDDDGDTAGEAIVGLARRKDVRAYEKIVEMINAGFTGTLILEAAEELGDKRLLEPLRRLLADNKEDTDSYWLSCIEGAIEVLEKERV